MTDGPAIYGPGDGRPEPKRKPSRDELADIEALRVHVRGAAAEVVREIIAEGKPFDETPFVPGDGHGGRPPSKWRR